MGSWKSITAALLNTPWWVYLVFVYVLFIGIKSLKTQVVSVKKLFIIPTLLILLSLNELVTAVNLVYFNIMVWCTAAAVGIFFGWLYVYFYNIQVDKKKKLIKIPGNWATLILLIIIFATKYFFGYELAIDPKRLEDTFFELTMLSVSGLCAGLFLGRLFCYLYRMNTHPSVDLQP